MSHRSLPPAFGTRLGVGLLMLWLETGIGVFGPAGKAAAQSGRFDGTVSHSRGAANSQPAQVPALWLTLSAGGYHTCGLTSASGVKCWGANYSGQLGDGTSTPSTTPVDVKGLTSGVIAVSAGGYHTCAVTSGGGLKCWGLNNHGQLGNGTTADSSTPVDVTGLTSGVSAVASSDYHTCAVTTPLGGVKCWGNNAYGQLGNGTTLDSSTPVNVNGLTRDVNAVEGGTSHTCALTSAEGLKCWGSNPKGQLGNGTATASSEPVNVIGLTSGVRAVSGGSEHTCAVTTSGGAKCWGGNQIGQLGNGTMASDSSTAVDVLALTSGVDAVTDGWYHTCALTSAGGAKCWGSNAQGQLGNGTLISTSTAVDVTGLTIGVGSVTGGWFHTCAVTSAGGAKCWGDNSRGQFGNGTTTSSTTPTQVVAPIVTGQALLWRHAVTGENAAWYLSGSSVVSWATFLSVADPNWEMAATADFNGDNQADLVWRNSATGQNAVWYMNGATFVSQSPLPTVADGAWQLVAAVDADLDGHPDLVWHNAATGQNALWYLNGTTLASTSALPTVADTLWQLVGAADVNGDGHPDLVWRHLSTGQNVVWYLDGAALVSTASLPNVAELRWRIGTLADFDSDGHPDLVWRDAVTGWNVVWFMNGTTIQSTAFLPPAPDAGWEIIGPQARPVPVKAPSDFNRDGQPDLLWRHASSGANAVWYLNGSTLSSTAAIATVADTNWQIVASADLNRDGQADLIWRHKTTGEDAVWYMKGATIAWTAPLPTMIDTNGDIVAVADFNADGHPDVVWRNRLTGMNMVWFMNGTTCLLQAAVTAVADTNWRIVASADFNADGKPDLVWRHLTSGLNAVWYMNGATKIGDALLPPVTDQAWQIAMAADFNADGKTDIAWRNYTTGQNVIWIMNGPTYVSNAALPAVTDPNWQMLKR